MAMTKRQTDNAREAIKSHAIIQRLTKIVNGEVNGTSVQVAAAKILLDKSLPSLQAVESTQIDATPIQSKTELYRQLAGILKSQPDLIADVLKARPELLREIGADVKPVAVANNV